MNPKYIMIGGFLGAGKTTTVARLARHFVSQGKKVAIVTNDQTTDLVDTQSLRSQGFEVGEVAGACFCCNFNELTATVEKLSAAEMPEIILAEPVGSCTDLVATVLRPLQRVYGRPLDIAPYGVILKPSHGRKILEGKPGSGFSPKAEYIFKKQIEEADFVLVNRIDELGQDQADHLVRLLVSEFPGRPIFRVSAKTGAGFDRFLEHLETARSQGTRILDLDYDIYAEGEAELGWLNSQVNVTAPSPFDLDHFLLDLIRGILNRFLTQGAESAHLKTIGMCEQTYAVANLVSNETGPELSLPSGVKTDHANVVINARVGTDPVVLEQLVREQVAKTCAAFGAQGEVATLQSFRPGRPVPTHRIVGAV